jgi:hypothetical protein
MTISDTGNWSLLSGATITSAATTIGINQTLFNVTGQVSFAGGTIHQISSHNFVQGDATNTYLYGGTNGLHFRSADNSTALIDISNTGNLTFATDNTQDIGASGATRPRNLYLGGSINATLPAIGANTGQVVLYKSDGTLTTDSTTLTWDSSNDLLSVNGLSIYSTGVRAAGSNDLQIGSANTFPSIVVRGSNGNVGVGSSTPFAKLSVKGVGATTGVNFQTTNSSDSPLFTVLDSGNVGIGTTGPGAALDVVGTIKSSGSLSAGTHKYGIMSDATIGGTTQSNMFYAGGTITASTAVTERAGLRVDSAGLGSGASITTQYGIYIANQTGATTNYGLYSAGANDNYFAGDVGIGVTNPSTKLEVNGSITAQGSIIFKDANNANTYGLRGLTGIVTLDAGSVYPTGWNFQYGNSASSALYINSGGNVGIGTTSPIAKLSVDSTTSASMANFNSNNASGGYIAFDKSGNNFGYIGNQDALTSSGGTGLALRSTGNLQFSTNGATTRMTLDTAGALSVTALVSCGGIQTNGSGTMSCTSDSRLKDIQSTFTSGLSAINQISPQTYSWKSNSSLYDGGVLYSGFIAQNIESAIPEAVNTNLDGYKQVNTTTILASAVNAIKELYTRTVALSTATTTPTVFVTSDANVAIGTTTGFTKFTVFSNVSSGGVATFQDSNATCVIDPTNSSLTCSSDERLKKNITTLNATSTLDKVMQLRPVTYNWNREDNSSQVHTGFIAQEVESIFPEFVSTTTNGMKSVAYSNFVPVMVEAIQALNTKVNAIDNRLTNLESLVATQATTTSPTLFSDITTWFASTANGIGDLVAGTFKAKEQICVDDQCLNKDDVRSLLALVRNGVGTTTPPVDNGNATTTDTTSPVITILGNNPATIEVGTSYGDLGATVTDTDEHGNINNNLGLHFTVDGIEVQTITLDTSTSTTHTIVYSAQDGAGNWGYATRTVDVIPQ